MPSMLADIGLIFVLNKMLKKLNYQKEDSKKTLLYCLILLNPAIYYISSAWGQTESIVLLFVVIAFYLTISKKRPLISSLFFTIALLIKQTSALFVPLYLIIYLKNNNWKTIFSAIIINLALFWISFLPFYYQGNLLLFPFTTYLQKILFVSSSSNVSEGALNFWQLYVGNRVVKDSSIMILFFTYKSISMLITGSLVLLIIYKLITQKSNKLTIIHSAFLIALTTFLFLMRIHERHLVYTLPFLALLAVKQKKYLLFYIYISLVLFINLYLKWSLVYSSFLIKILNNSILQNTLIIGLVIVLISEIRLLFSKNIENKLQ